MISKAEKKYKTLLLKVLQKGEKTTNRTSVKTIKLFNESLNINLQKGFPIITSKKIFFTKALAEFRWMYEGRTDLQYLNNNKVNWWNEFAINNTLGKVYGYQIKNFNGVYNQIEYCIKEIKKNSRRAIITLWNPCDLKEQSLPCCFTQMNFVRSNNKLNLSVHFRSSDLFLGLPYDIIVAALFLHTIANKVNLIPYKLGLNLADGHIYLNHLKNVNIYLKNKSYPLPIFQGGYNNYTIKNYISEQYLKTPLIK